MVYQQKENILVDDKKIVKISENIEESGAKVLDLEGKFISPGFIDVHTHGAYGYDTNDVNEEGLRNWTKNVVSEGGNFIFTNNYYTN